MSAATSTVQLRAGETSCEIAPEMGCCVTRFETVPLSGGAPQGWLRRFKPGRSDVPWAGSGCFPLFPDSGRIAWGRLRWRGRTVDLPTGLLDDAHALHGTGRVGPWAVVPTEANRAEFRLVHVGEGWPFPFEATLRFALAERILRIGLELVNTGAQAMPAGMGLHPIFEGRDLHLRADARTVWRIDGDKLFMDRTPAAPPWNFCVSASLMGTNLEHGFSDWDGRFELVWPDRGQSLVVTSSEALRHLVVYTRAYDASPKASPAWSP